MKRLGRLIPGVMICLLLSGCGDAGTKESVQFLTKGYERSGYVTYEVAALDIEPEVKLVLTSENYRKKTVYPAGDDLKIESVAVEVGDCVKKGDILLTYESKDMEDMIKEYQQEIEMDQMLYDHYSKLYEIEKSTSLEDTIRRLEQSIQVNSMYVRELRQRITDNSVLAESDGIVSEKAKLLENSYTSKKEALFTMIYADGTFTAESMEDIDPDPEALYEAESGLVTYRFRFLSKEQAEDGTFLYRFQFVPGDSVFCPREFIDLCIKRTAMYQAICVPKEYVVYAHDKAYVYILEEDGFRRVQEVVVTEETLDGWAVLADGVSIGDKVVMR